MVIFRTFSTIKSNKLSSELVFEVIDLVVVRVLGVVVVFVVVDKIVMVVEVVV